jgi:hypothetical protein
LGHARPRGGRRSTSCTTMGSGVGPARNAATSASVRLALAATTVTRPLPHVCMHPVPECADSSAVGAAAYPWSGCTGTRKRPKCSESARCRSAAVTAATACANGSSTSALHTPCMLHPRSAIVLPAKHRGLCARYQERLLQGACSVLARTGASSKAAVDERCPRRVELERRECRRRARPHLLQHTTKAPQR